MKIPDYYARAAATDPANAAPQLVSLDVIWRVIRSQLGQNFFEHLRGIDESIVAIDNFPARRDEDSVRQRARPLGVECLDQCVGAGLRIEKIRGVAALGRQEAFNPAGRR